MIRNILEENDNVQPNDRTMEVLHREFPQCFNAEGKFDMVALQELLQDIRRSPRFQRKLQPFLPTGKLRFLHRQPKQSCRQRKSR